MTSLLTRLAQAKGPDRELDALVAYHIAATTPGWTMHEDSKPGADVLWVWRDGVCHNVSSWGPFTASLDAVLGLLPEGWFWRVGHSTLYGGWAHLNRKHPNHCDVGDEYSANAETPAIALLIAILRARGIE